MTMTTTMSRRQPVHHRRRTFQSAASSLLLCYLMSSTQQCCLAFAFAFSTSNVRTTHKMMTFCHHRPTQQLLGGFGTPLRSHQSEGEVSLSTDESIVTDLSLSRRKAITAMIASSTIITTSITPQLANADVTNKVASTTALRSLSNLKTQLPIRLKPLAQSNNYVGIKQCLREPPLDGIRKNMLTLVRGGEDGPKAGELLLAYKQLISALENMDASATLGMQGRNKKNYDPFLLSLQYDEVEKALGVFIDIGAAAASIPLQEGGGGQTKVGSIDVRSGEVTPRVL